ncbi:hypothetical protein [Rhodohalobacter sp.]|uniref:alpha/beta hydrolase family protein n=1 Tax=Rhodohalobacter sp. TaxID=1974210 RepID=UPI002ACE3B28|nr:hypothetical protein [Rhodohalobacter sp.]MDZ7757164.1 hypothetical protein [Rhodohalobacter sp.]
MFKKFFKELAIGVFVSGLFLLFPYTNAFTQDMREMEVVYKLSEMSEVTIQKGAVYKSTEERDLTIDLYYPHSADNEEKYPAVIFVLGYPNFNLKEMQSYISWGKLVATHNMIGVNYETSNPETDLTDLINYLLTNAEELNIDKERIGIWSCSGNVPVALSHLHKSYKPYLRFGVFYYGIMNTSDQKYQTEIDNLSSNYGFISPHIKPGQQLPKDLSMLVVRSGQDNIPNINDTIDHFTNIAISNNLPVTLINFSDGQHAFDFMDDKEESRRIIRQTLTYMEEKFSSN